MITDAMVEAACRADYGWCTKDDESGWDDLSAETRADDVARIRFILEAAEQAAWRPIAEAPEDDTLVMIYDPVSNCDGAHQFYVATFSDWYPEESPMHGMEPTHYRPLPPGPKE